MAAADWDTRFSDLIDKLEEVKKASKQNAVAAAAKVSHEAHRAANEVKRELKLEIARGDAQRIVITEKLDRVNDSLIKLQNAKIVQQGFTSLVLAGMIIVLIKVLGG